MVELRLALGVALFALGCGKAQVTPPAPIVWHSLADGEALARAEHRPAILFFRADWDTSQKELENVTFADPDVRAEMARYVAIKVDITDEELPAVSQAKSRFRVIGDPVVLGLSDFAPGGERFRINEFVGPAAFTKTVHEATERTR